MRRLFVTSYRTCFNTSFHTVCLGFHSRVIGTENHKYYNKLGEEDLHLFRELKVD